MPSFRKPSLAGLGLVLAAVAVADGLPPATFIPPPGAITIEEQTVRFRAEGFAYVSPNDGATWEASATRDTLDTPALFQARRVYTDTSGVQTIFQSELRQDAAGLLIWTFDGLRVDPLANLDLYDRWMVREAIGRKRGRKFLLTPEDTLPSAPRPAPALFGKVHRAGYSLWFGVGWQAGPARGIGALVRHELDTRQTKIIRPYVLENRLPARIALTPDAVWIAVADTVRGKFRCRGLLRFDPLHENAEPVALPLTDEDDEIRVLEAASDTIWLATRSALYRTTDEATTWTRWRLRSTTRVDRREEISSTPGVTSRRAIPSGTYFVLAMTNDSLLVQTDDGIEGWIPPDSLAEDPVFLRDTPSFAGTLLGRFPAGDAIERLPLRTPDGWTKARVRAGWLARKERTPRPVVAAAEELPRQAE